MPQVSHTDFADQASRIAQMRREDLLKMLRGMRCTFQVDFTDAFLAAMSLERLRHVVLAASLHNCSR